MIYTFILFGGVALLAIVYIQIEKRKNNESLDSLDVESHPMENTFDESDLPTATPVRVSEFEQTTRPTIVRFEYGGKKHEAAIFPCVEGITVDDGKPVEEGANYSIRWSYKTVTL